MDFYVDLAVAVLLRLIKDKRNYEQYLGALAKVFVRIEALAGVDERLAVAIRDKRREP